MRVLTIVQVCCYMSHCLLFVVYLLKFVINLNNSCIYEFDLVPLDIKYMQ